MNIVNNKWYIISSMKCIKRGICMNLKERNKIPKATARRLPLYYRYVLSLHDEGIERFSSAELSQAIHVDSATIRRDFSYFGELGKRGYGYDVKELLTFFAQLLKEDHLMNVAVVGVGNLGSALLKFSFKNTRNIRISCAFDIKESLVGQIVDGLPIYHIDDLQEQLKRQNINIAILAVPTDVAQDVTDTLVEAGVKGILNFTTQHLVAPSPVVIQDVDLTTELQTLIYFVKVAEENE